MPGELAQLARALRWQRRGHRFEPGILHLKPMLLQRWFFYTFFSAIV